MEANNNNWLETCLDGLAEVSVGVFGDFCLDAYWLLDPCEDELSVETGLPVRRVREQRYSLGGAANVAANLEALGVGRIHAIGLIGDDLYGGLMLKMLRQLNVHTTGLSVTQSDWQTPVFGKP